MVVEDEALIVLDLQNMLKNLGYDVSDPARSGAEALAWQRRSDRSWLR
jgi:CheY-like chemotaxis protein